jgi:hypothetical protein
MSKLKVTLKITLAIAGLVLLFGVLGPTEYAQNSPAKKEQKDQKKKADDKQKADDKKKGKDKHILDNPGSDPSPIIISDGASIHLMQTFPWVYRGQRNVAVMSDNFLAHRVKVGLCTLDMSTCDASLIDERVTGKSWTLYLCQTGTCNAGNYAATLGPNPSDGRDVEVTAQDPFLTEADSGGAPRFYLANPHLKYAALTVRNPSGPTTADCLASNPAGPKICVVTVCYASAANKCN